MQNIDARASSPELPALFRPRAARMWAYSIGGVVVAASIVMAIILPGENSNWTDRLGFLLFGAAIFWFCHRQATVRVEAREDAVTVRNLFSTRRYSWPELFAVRFHEGDPWAHVDLSDGDTVSLMALQRADRAHGVEQARAFNALIERYGTADVEQ